MPSTLFSVTAFAVSSTIGWIVALVAIGAMRRWRSRAKAAEAALLGARPTPVERKPMPVENVLRRPIAQRGRAIRDWTGPRPVRTDLLAAIDRERRKHFVVGVTHGMSGYFAVVYDKRTGEPEITGIGRYDTREEAVVEARHLSESEGIPLEDGLLVHAPNDSVKS